MAYRSGPNRGFSYSDQGSTLACCGCTTLMNFSYLTAEQFHQDYKWWCEQFPYRQALLITNQYQHVAAAELKKLGAIPITRMINDSDPEGNLTVWQLSRPTQPLAKGVTLTGKEQESQQRFDVERAFI